MKQLFELCDALDQADITIEEFRKKLLEFLSKCDATVLHDLATDILNKEG